VTRRDRLPSRKEAGRVLLGGSCRPSMRHTWLPTQLPAVLASVTVPAALPSSTAGLPGTEGRKRETLMPMEARLAMMLALALALPSGAKVESRHRET
jgi:hypothetical protein